MDKLYVKQACQDMKWDPLMVELPSPGPYDDSDNNSPQNRGYCFLTFSSQQEVDAILSQIDADKSLMLKSTQPFKVKQHYFSVYVGNLLPETTGEDLLAVFQDPARGQQGGQDQGYKRVKPFFSCCRALIVKNHATGAPRGFGYVR